MSGHTKGSCSVCERADRAAIDEAILRGDSYGRISEMFGIPKSTVYGHGRLHVARDSEQAAAVSHEVLIEKLEKLELHPRRILSKAERVSDYRAAVAAIRVDLARKDRDGRELFAAEPAFERVAQDALGARRAFARAARVNGRRDFGREQREQKAKRPQQHPEKEPPCRVIRQRSGGPDHRAACAIMERRLKARRLDCPLVFHRSGGRSFEAASGGLSRCCYEMWNTACQKLKLSVVPYDLRRTVVRNLRAAGVPERVIMEITGHRTREMFDRYGIVDERDMRAAFEVTAKYVEGLPRERKIVAIGSAAVGGPEAVS